jgi:hypothetical protein
MRFRLEHMIILILTALLIYTYYKYRRELNKDRTLIKHIDKKRNRHIDGGQKIQEISALHPNANRCEVFLDNYNNGILFCRISN